jgi:putative phosphoesterase
MRLGIISDTHDRLDAARAGFYALRDAGADYYLHCGDVGQQRILDLFAGLPMSFVWGNNDWDLPELTRYAVHLGLKCHDRFADLSFEGLSVAMTHGDDMKIVRQVLQDQSHDYLLLGHSHEKRDERVGRVRIINPGALYRAREKSVAVLDTRKDELRFIPIRA